MPRIHTLAHGLAIWVYANDHAPPHFHLKSPDGDAMIDMATFQVIRGQYKRSDLVEALTWAAANADFLRNEWTRLNERD